VQRDGVWGIGADCVDAGVKGGRVKKNTQAGRAKIKPEVLEGKVYGSDEDDGPIELEENMDEAVEEV
jgi:hypothetical protein